MKMAVLKTMLFWISWQHRKENNAETERKTNRRSVFPATACDYLCNPAYYFRYFLKLYLKHPALIFENTCIYTTERESREGSLWLLKPPLLADIFDSDRDFVIM